ncbi:LytR family transcriptional regulator [Enterococcus faecium]|nr:LytR family transcriptional regulator [Enterococcus faecium]
MKVSQKIILSILLLLTLVVGYFSIEFIHGFSSAKQSSTVKKVEPKTVARIHFWLHNTTRKHNKQN